MTLSETWLKDDQNLLDHVQFNGYHQPVYRNRDNKRGGGIGAYIKSSVSFKLRPDINSMDKSIEHLWVEIKGKNKNSSLLIGIFYQPSSQERDKLVWIDKLNQLLSQIHIIWQGPLVIVGDMNIDLLSEKNKQSLKDYKELLKDFELYQHITKPTRKGKSLLDHVISNIPRKLITENVLPADEVSDHDSPFVVLNIRKEHFEPRYKYIRQEKHFQLNNYKNDFSELPLNLVYAFNDPNTQISVLNDLITNCIDHHAPLKRIKFTRPAAPWMKDPEIQRLQHHRNHYRRLAHQLQDDESWFHFRNARNNLKKNNQKNKINIFQKGTIVKKTKRSVENNQATSFTKQQSHKSGS